MFVARFVWQAIHDKIQAEAHAYFAKILMIAKAATPDTLGEATEKICELLGSLSSEFECEPGAKVGGFAHFRMISDTECQTGFKAQADANRVLLRELQEKIPFLLKLCCRDASAVVDAKSCASTFNLLDKVGKTGWSLNDAGNFTAFRRFVFERFRTALTRHFAETAVSSIEFAQKFAGGGDVADCFADGLAGLDDDDDEQDIDHLIFVAEAMRQIVIPRMPKDTKHTITIANEVFDIGLVCSTAPWLKVGRLLSTLLASNVNVEKVVPSMEHIVQNLIRRVIRAWCSAVTMADPIEDDAVIKRCTDCAQVWITTLTGNLTEPRI